MLVRLNMSKVYLSDKRSFTRLRVKKFKRTMLKIRERRGGES
jgi:hypothetical protein